MSMIHNERLWKTSDTNTSKVHPQFVQKDKNIVNRTISLIGGQFQIDKQFNPTQKHTSNSNTNDHF